MYLMFCCGHSPFKEKAKIYSGAMTTASSLARSIGSILRSVGSAIESSGIALQGSRGTRDALNTHQTIQAFKELRPKIPASAPVFIAPNASIIGDVSIGEHSSVWYGSVIRGDVNSVRIGSRTNIQDNVMVHVAKHNAQNAERATTIGDNVTVGHGATLHACTVEDNAVVGMGAVVMDGCVVESNAIVGAGSLVVPGTVVKSSQVWAGRPAKYVREVTQGEKDAIGQAAVDYSSLSAVHAEENSKSFGEIELDAARRWDRNTRDPDYDVQNQVDRDPETRAMRPVGYIATE
jgi:carbonic anhydrase/acetyltransferase-like protein (isoleucine patch superfamily)